MSVVTTADLGDAAIAKSNEFADRICACSEKDKAQDCYKLPADMQAWVAEVDDKMRDYKPSPDQGQRMRAAADRISGCMRQWSQHTP